MCRLRCQRHRPAFRSSVHPETDLSTVLPCAQSPLCARRWPQHLERVTWEVVQAETGAFGRVRQLDGRRGRSAWPPPAVWPRAGCCLRPQLPTCVTGRQGRAGIAAGWPQGVRCPLPLSQGPRIRRQPLRCPCMCSGPEPLPGHGASGTIQFMLKRHSCLRPHGQQRGQTDSAEPLGSSCASAQSVLLGVRGAGVPVLGVGTDPQGCRVPGTWSWLGPPHVQRIGVLSDPPGRVPRPRDALQLWSAWARALAPST